VIVCAVTESTAFDAGELRVQENTPLGWVDIGARTVPCASGAIGIVALPGGGERRYLIADGFSAINVAGLVAGATSDAPSMRLAWDGSSSQALADSILGLESGDSLQLEYVPDDSSAAVADPCWLVLQRTLGAEGGSSGGRALPMNTALPMAFALRQNHPNPFGGTTQIKFELPTGTRVKLEIFDLFGRRVRTLANDVWSAGYHHVEWDGRGEDGTLVPAGVYAYRMTAGSFRAQRKMVLLSR